MKNTKGKTRPIGNPYEVYQVGTWIWRVLCHYKGPDGERKDPYARVFCAVISPITGGDPDYGDVYCKDIPGYRYEE